jgi:GNAT superfamily N-acetyltransferase
MAHPTWTIRLWQPGDSLDALTALLHRAYAPLAAAGMNFTAATQTAAMTSQRMQGSHTWVAVRSGGTLVGTITAAGPFDPNAQGWAHALPWFYRQDVAHFHQYAVDPACQGQGIGAALLRAAEAWARGAGHRAMLLDTAEPAATLRQRYARAGYADIASVQWQGKAYRSVVMAKPLADPVPADTDPAHHAATVRALWASFQARDWVAARRCLADDATLFWRASGEHLLDADAIIRVQVVYPEGWALHVVDVTPMADGRVHSLVQVRHGSTCFLAHTLWQFRGPLVVHADETWATWETPPTWRTAEAIGAYRRDAGDSGAGVAPLGAR